MTQYLTQNIRLDESPGDSFQRNRWVLEQPDGTPRATMRTLSRTFCSSGVHISCGHRPFGLICPGNDGARDDQDHRRGFCICRLCLCDVRNRIPPAKLPQHPGRSGDDKFDELSPARHEKPRLEAGPYRDQNSLGGNMHIFLYVGHGSRLTPLSPQTVKTSRRSNSHDALSGAISNPPPTWCGR